MQKKSVHLKLVIPTNEAADMEKAKQIHKTEKVKKSVQPRRTIVLPEELWQRLDSDAARCFRSANGHIEAILSAIFMNADTALHGIDRGRDKTSDDFRARAAG